MTITGDAAGDDVTDAAGITDVAASGAGRLDDNSRIFDASDRADPRRPDPDRRAHHGR